MSLGRELWEKIEAAQGYAFIADDVRGMSDNEVRRIAENALVYTRRCEGILRRFLEKHGRAP